MQLRHFLFACTILSLPLTIACNSADKASVDDAIKQREKDKGYSIIDTKIIKKTDQNGHLIVVFTTTDGDTKIITDTVSFSRTGDGVLVQE